MATTTDEFRVQLHVFYLIESGAEDFKLTHHDLRGVTNNFLTYLESEVWKKYRKILYFGGYDHGSAGHVISKYNWSYINKDECDTFIQNTQELINRVQQTDHKENIKFCGNGFERFYVFFEILSKLPKSLDIDLSGWVYPY